MHSWFRHFAGLLICAGFYLGFAAAQETGNEKKTTPAPKLLEVPKVLQTHKLPETVEDLRAIEKHVKKVLDKVTPSVVGVLVGPGQGSGVIVKTDGTVLTAGHVSGEPKKKARVIMPGGKFINADTLGRFVSIDSGMVKISEEGTYPALEMGKSSELKVGQWVVAVGHPGGFRPNRGPVVRVGRILFVNQFVIRTDCTLVGGDSGGPLFDMQGRVIGIHSRIGGLSITENMHVPVDTYLEHWQKLAQGESWGSALGQMPTVLSMGGTKIFEAKDKLTKDDPTEPCPKDPKDKNLSSHRKIYNLAMKSGHVYTLDLVSADKSGTKLDTYLRLEGPDGKELAHDDDGGGFPHSRIVYRAQKDGEHKIIATSFESKQTGSYTLTVRDAVLYSGKVELLKAIKVPAPAVEKLFKELVKGSAKLQIHGMLVDAKGAILPGKELTVQWATGKESIKSTVDGFIVWNMLKDKTKGLSVKIPKGMKAAFVLTDQNGNNIPLGWDEKDPSIEKVKSAGGKIVKTFDGNLAKTDPFDIERDKCVRHIHEFKMQAGKTYTLDLTSDEVDSYLRIEHDDMGKLAEDDDGAGFLNSRIVFTPKKDDTFRIVVTTCDPGQFGAYRLTIRETLAIPEKLKVDKK